MGVKTARILFICFLLFIVGICSYSDYHDKELAKQRKIAIQKEQQRHLEVETASYDSVKILRDIDLCLSFLHRYSASKYREDVQAILKQSFNIQTNQVLEKGDSAAITDFYLKYIAVNMYVVSDDLQRLRQRIDEITIEHLKQEEFKQFGTEPTAWKTAESLQSEYGYEKYLEYHPRGKHAKAAEQKIIDIQVKRVFAGKHGNLPEMDKVGYSYGSISDVSIYNNTGYTLTLLYSGNDSKRLVLQPRQSGSVKLKNGRYRIAAFVNAPKVTSYAGIENLNGGSYSSEYYITTSRY